MFVNASKCRQISFGSNPSIAGCMEKFPSFQELKKITPTARSEACMILLGLTLPPAWTGSPTFFPPQELLAECRRYATPPLVNVVIIILGDLRAPRH